MIRIHRRDVLLAAASICVLAAVGAHAAPAARPAIKVYKDPTCGCCTAWADRLTAAGFDVTVEAREDMAALKAKLGVPDELSSCHTGVIAGYAIEGHVPPEDIKKLIAKRPAAKGIAVPGMPVNSPGMEVPGEASEPYTVWLFRKDGTHEAFAQHGA